MNSSGAVLHSSEAAARLGISGKALRLYERRGLIAPLRTMAGWRTYGPVEMDRAARIVALRRLGFGLTEIARLLQADPPTMRAALAAHQAVLESRIRDLSIMAMKLCDLRRTHARAEASPPSSLPSIAAEPGVEFELPWPWGGERFVLHELPPLTYITGPLGSGKTQLARLLGARLPNALFIGADRTPAAHRRLATDSRLAAHVERELANLVDEGASASEELEALLALLLANEERILVVDHIEQGLDGPSQAALGARLRRRRRGAPPLLALTRSTAILDLASVGPDQAMVLYCPANHGPPLHVVPCRGAPGYEAVVSCLATPEVRARTAGVVAWRPCASPAVAPSS